MAQKKNPSKKDWVTKIAEDMETYNITLKDEDIDQLTESDFKKIVKQKVRQKAFKECMIKLSGHEKVNKIHYENMNEPQDYLSSKIFNNKQISLLMNLRCQTVKGFKNNLLALLILTRLQ